VLNYCRIRQPTIVSTSFTFGGIMRRSLIVSLAAVALAAFPHIRAVAQQQAGDKEVQVFGNVTTISSNGTSYSSGSVGGSIGYFFTRQLQLSGGAFVTLSGGGGASTTTQTQLSGGLRFNFATEGRKAFPYVGMDMGTSASSDGSPSQSFYRPSAGFKTFFTRNAAFDLNVGYMRFTQQQQDAPTMIDSQFGLSFVF
jgi:hypothetical protein